MFSYETFKVINLLCEVFSRFIIKILNVHHYRYKTCSIDNIQSYIKICYMFNTSE